MKMKKILAVTLALLMLVTCFAACGKKTQDSTTAPKNEETKRKFIMGVDPEYPPFSNLGDDGEYTGFDIEVCKAVCDYLGWDFEVFAVNWSNKLIQLNTKECDCIWSGLTILDSMKEQGYVISKPYFDNRQVLLVKNDSGFNTSKDLSGKYVAVQLGTSGEKLLNNDLKDLAATFKEVVTCDSFLKCFTELEGNAVDAVFVDQPVADEYIANHNGYKVIDENFGVEQYGIVFRSTDQELCQEVEKAVAALVENGTYAKIAEKYPDIKDNLIFLK